MQVVHQPVAVDLLAIDIQIFDLRTEHIAQQRLAALGDGQELVIAVNAAGEGENRCADLMAVGVITLFQITLQAADRFPVCGQRNVIGKSIIFAIAGVSAVYLLLKVEQILRRSEQIGIVLRTRTFTAPYNIYRILRVHS